MLISAPVIEVIFFSVILPPSIILQLLLFLDNHKLSEIDKHSFINFSVQKIKMM
jgi:hypothetical protein